MYAQAEPLPPQPPLLKMNCCQPVQPEVWPHADVVNIWVLSWREKTPGLCLPFRSMYSLVTPVTLSNNPSATEMKPDAGSAEKSVPFPTVKGRTPRARKKGVFG